MAKHMSLPQSSRAFIFLAADYGNIGDLAITAAQRSFLTRFAPNREVIPVPISGTRELIRSIRKQVTADDLITTIGGGNMGSLYPDIEELRQLVIRSFPDNRIVCFPQTLDWDDSKASQQALERIARVYSRHPDLHVFARESESYAKLQRLFEGRSSVKVGFVPDIVLSATAQALGAEAGGEHRTGALLCLRDDRERLLNVADHAALERALVNAGLTVEVTDTHAGGSRLKSNECSRLLADKLAQFQCARLIVTDRLHGMILSALAGTPCLVLPNTNHKIYRTWLDWLTTVPQVRFLSLDELPKIEDAVAELLELPSRDSSVPVIDAVQYEGLSTAISKP